MKIKAQCTNCNRKNIFELGNSKEHYVSFACQGCQKEFVFINPRYYKIGALKNQSTVTDIQSSEKSFFEFCISIRTKIIAVMVLLVMISLSFVGWVASAKSRSALGNQAESFLRLNAVQKTREYTIIFERIQQEVEAVAGFTKGLYEQKSGHVDMHLRQHILMPWSGDGYGSPQLEEDLHQEVLTLQQLVPFLVNIVSKNPFAQAGYFGSASRIMVMDDPAAIKSIGQVTAFINTKRPWYLKAKRKGKTIWSEPYIDADTKDLIVTCATPVRLDNGKMVGVAAYDVLLSTIQKDILALDIGYNSYAFLVNHRGNAIVRPGMDKSDTRWDKTYNTTDLLNTDNSNFNLIVQNMVAGYEGFEIYNTEEGEKYAAYAPLPVIGASMAIVASKNEVVAPAVSMQRVIIWVWAVVLVIGVAIGIYIGNGITKPINELTQAADRISQGEMDLEVLTEDRKDEIGRLTRALNRLVTSLKIAMTMRE